MNKSLQSHHRLILQDAAMQIEKAVMNNHLRFQKVS